MALRILDAYGMYVRRLRSTDRARFEDEPANGLETALTLQLTVASDLEPSWTLISERAQAQGLSRNLNWPVRVRIAPMRIGAMAGYHPG